LRLLRHAGLAAVLVCLPLAASADEPKVVVPFDFVSRFDHGTLGAQLGDMVWAKLNRQQGFVIPESMHDVRDFVRTKNLVIGPDTDFKQVRQAVVEEFSAQIGIWGGIERAPGHESEIYDIVLKCYDFSTDPPRMIYDRTARTNSAAEVPHVYVKQLLDALYQRTPAPARPDTDPVAEANWNRNPNLLPGGDFQRGTGGVPLGWEDRGGQAREPLGRQVQWLNEVGNTPNKVIRLTMNQALGDSFGVMYYSRPFPVNQGATYRIQYRWRSSGPAVKVFVKVYGEMSSPYQAEGAESAASEKRAKAVPESLHAGVNPRNLYGQELEGREVYRSQQNCKGPKNQWNVHVEDFTPRHTKYDLKFGKVELFGYHGAGVVEFDDFVLKEIVAASPSALVGPRRHSSATRVTLKEMEHNERRSREAQRAEPDNATPPPPLRRRSPD
jgi:hypothetical protein